jgi:acyl-CoA thioesterase-1
MLTRWALFHVASGQSFFTGAACLVLAACLSVRKARRGVSAARNALVSLGGLLVFVSATPLPPWLYIALVVASLPWLAIESLGDKLPARLVVGWRCSFVAMWAAAVLVELPYHVLPGIPKQPGRPKLGIIGDSLTAGTGDRETVTWPRIFADRQGVTVRDHSMAGAGVASALRQASTIAPDERLVLLEIGGNDILGGASPAAFEAGLARLISEVSRPDRVVIMFELPLPPTYNAFGLAQRRVAMQYEVILVPKRVLLGVLLQLGATLDSIHLSPEGHRRMADSVWGVLRPAYEDETRP